MKSWNISRIILTVALSTLTTGIHGEESTSDSQGIETDDFQVGDSCAALAYLTYAQMREIARAGFQSELNAFCYPEEPSDCSEYASLISGIGKLVTSESGYYCSLILPK